MLWHDQTKVGRYDQAIRIPEWLFSRLAARRETTVSRFIARHGRAPTAAERAAMALFPGRYRNPDGTAAVTYQWFHRRVQGLGRRARHRPLGPPPGQAHAGHQPAAPRRDPHPHPPLPRARLRPDGRALHPAQPLRPGGRPAARVGRRARHTPAPARCCPGPATPITREQAQALAIDLSRRSTPAEGGFCTFQPVVDGGACPWNLDCHNCANFVLSGADLLYWRRKREQWYSIAERAPDDATASWLHQVFAPDRGRHRRAGSRPGRRSACSTTRSPWTCAARRTTSSGSGTSGSAPPSSPAPPQTSTPSPMTSRTRTATSWRKQHDPRPHRGRDRGPPPRHRAETAAGPRRRRQPQAPQGAGHLPGRRPPGRGIPHVPLRQPRRP